MAKKKIEDPGTAVSESASPAQSASPAPRRPAPRRGAAGGAAARGAAPDGEARSAPTRDEIAEAAYHRYVSRGRQHGFDADDWYEAERELSRRGTGSSARKSG